MTRPGQPPPPALHLDGATLAELQEDLLEGTRATAAREHLGGCAACAARRDALEDVRAQLARAGRIDPAPPDVVRRVDAALADAALADAAPAAAAATATVTPLAARRRSSWGTRALQSAAVFVLVAAAAAVGYGALVGSDGTGTPSAERAASGQSGHDRAGGSSGTGRYRVTASGRDYTAAALRAAVPDLVAGRVAARSGGPAPSVAPDGSAGPTTQDRAEAEDQRLARGPELAACVANLAGGPVTPLAVDIARFEGRPATVIVLPTEGDAGSVDVFAVAPRCRAGEFLTFARVPLR